MTLIEGRPQSRRPWASTGQCENAERHDRLDLLVSTREGAGVPLTVAPHVVAVRGDLTVEPTAEDLTIISHPSEQRWQAETTQAILISHRRLDAYRKTRRAGS